MNRNSSSKKSFSPKNFLGIYTDFFRNNIFAISLIIGFTIRIALLLKPQQYWFDEVLSTYIARYNDSIGNLIRFLQVGEYHPPAYYVIMFYWTRAFGISETATRSFSLIFGLATLPLFYLFARKLFSKKVSDLALLLLCINALHIEYSVEARPYAFFTFVGLLAAYFFVLLIKKRKKIYWFWFILLNIVGLYIHYSYSFIFGSFIVFMLFSLLSKKIDKKYKFSFREVVFTATLVALGFIPWLPTLINRYLEAINGLDFYKVKSDLDYFPGFRLTHVENLILSLSWLTKYPVTKWELFIITIGKISTFFLILPLFSNKKHLADWRLIFLGIIFSTPIVLFMFTKYFIPYSYNNTRHIIFSVYPLCLFLSFGYWNPKAVNLKNTLLLLFLLSLIIPLAQVAANDSNYDYEHRFKNVANYIEANEKPGDLILINRHLFTVIFNHYYKGQNKVTAYFPVKNQAETINLLRGGISSMDTKFMIHSTLLNENNYKSLSEVIGGNKRVWLIYTINNFNFIRYFLESNWTLVNVAPIENAHTVLLFEKNMENCQGCTKD